jgi:hypothetical protein
VKFASSEALNRELADSPAVRPEVVARARELVADVQYPRRKPSGGLPASSLIISARKLVKPTKCEPQ